MKLEDIAKLMSYINGKVDDLSDDILHDKQLYNLLCKLICILDRKGIYTPLEISEEINKNLGAEYGDEEQKRLSKVLFIMIMGYRSSYLRRQIGNGVSNKLKIFITSKFWFYKSTETIKIERSMCSA